MKNLSSAVDAIGKVNYPDVDKIASLIQSLTTFSDKIERIAGKTSS